MSTRHASLHTGYSMESMQHLVVSGANDQRAGQTLMDNVGLWIMLAYGLYQTLMVNTGLL